MFKITDEEYKEKQQSLIKDIQKLFHQLQVRLESDLALLKKHNEKSLIENEIQGLLSMGTVAGLFHAYITDHATSGTRAESKADPLDAYTKIASFNKGTVSTIIDTLNPHNQQQLEKGAFALRLGNYNSGIRRVAKGFCRLILALCTGTLSEFLPGGLWNQSRYRNIIGNIESTTNQLEQLELDKKVSNVNTAAERAVMK